MKWIYFILGALIPLPVFFDLLTRTVLVKSGWPIEYTLSFGEPVPLGIFAVAILGLMTFFVQKRHQVAVEINHRSAFIAAFFTAIFAIFASRVLSIARTVSLIFPFLSIYFIFRYSQCKQLFQWSLLGYGVSVVSLIVAHASSIFFYQLLGFESHFYLFTSFFNLVIYQALISYSAVLSFLGCTLIITSGVTKNSAARLSSLLLAFVIFYVVGFGARKAALADVLIAFTCCLVYVCVLCIFRAKIPKPAFLSKAAFSFVLVYLLLFSGFATREMTVGAIVSQRGDAYELFFRQITESSLYDIVLGNGGGWGGYSNLIVVMLFRLGVLGLLLFTIAGFYAMKFIIRYLGTRFLAVDGDIKVGMHTKIWLCFMICSLIVGNLVNMNLQLPYYVLNIAFIGLSFLNWSTKRNSTSEVLASGI